MGTARSAFWLGRDTWMEPASCAGRREPLRRAVGSLRDQTVPANDELEKLLVQVHRYLDSSR